jgi:hypothetical protein
MKKPRKQEVSIEIRQQEAESSMYHFQRLDFFKVLRVKQVASVFHLTAASPTSRPEPT